MVGAWQGYMTWFTLVTANLPLSFAQIHNERSGQMQHAEDIISQLDQRITTSGSETKELQVRIGHQHEKLVMQHPDAWRMSQSTGRQNSRRKHQLNQRNPRPRAMKPP